MTRALPGLLLAGSLLFAQSARAESDAVRPRIGNTDGAYGRFRGDTEWSVAAGVEAASAGPRFGVHLAAHYFWMVGVYLESMTALGPREDRSLLGGGVSFRPLFLPRFALDLEQGPARLDLFLDSLSLCMGPYSGTGKRGHFQRPGLATFLRAGFPLQTRAQGFWIDAQVGLRFPATAEPAHAFGALLFSYRGSWLTPGVAGNEL